MSHPVDARGEPICIQERRIGTLEQTVDRIEAAAHRIEVQIASAQLQELMEIIKLYRDQIDILKDCCKAGTSTLNWHTRWLGALWATAAGAFYYLVHEISTLWQHINELHNK